MHRYCLHRDGADTVVRQDIHLRAAEDAAPTGTHRTVANFCEPVRAAPPGIHRTRANFCVVGDHQFFVAIVVLVVHNLVSGYEKVIVGADRRARTGGRSCTLLFATLLAPGVLPAYRAYGRPLAQPRLDARVVERVPTVQEETVARPHRLEAYRAGLAALMAVQPQAATLPELAVAEVFGFKGFVAVVVSGNEDPHFTDTRRKVQAQGHWCAVIYFS